jgi:glycosyltransferase involved in cell wall biosynthesis
MGKKKTRKEKIKKPTISLCMIVKNEEAYLGRCLESVRHCVDEMIIVDTGSTDQTLTIAKSYGARIYHHHWENDFSKHRNQSLSYATGDWIFQLDADEELFVEDGDKLKEIVQSERADYYHCRFYDMEKDGSVHGVFHLIRLFRNGMGMSYMRKVHNQLCRIGTGAYSDLRIRHFGYDLPRDKMEAKHIRTTTMLEEMIATNPDDVYSRYQLAASYAMHNDYDKAVEHGELALRTRREKGLTDSYFINAFYAVGQGYLALGDLENAERTFLEALDYFDLNLDACYMLANIYFRRRDAEKCKEMSYRYQGILDKLQRNPELMRGVYFCNFTNAPQIYFGLGCVAYTEKNHKAMDRYFQQSFEMEGCKAEKALMIAHFFIDADLDERCMKWLAVAYKVGSRDKDIITHLKNRYEERMEREEALRIITDLLNLFPEWAALWSAAGDLQIRLANPREAARNYGTSLKLDPQNRETYLKLILTHETFGDLGQATLLCRELCRRFPTELSALLKMGKLLQDTEPEEAIEYLQMIPEESLGEFDRYEKAQLEIKLFWRLEMIQPLFVSLEKLMISLGMETDIAIDTVTDLGHILYDVSEAFCRRKEWDLAGSILKIAHQISPDGYQADRFAAITNDQSFPSP